MPLPDGQWLSFATALPEGGPSFSRQFLLSMGLMAVIILAVSVWAVRRVTAPLASLSAAAERLGNDLNAPPMPETGTIETRQASRAFNTMQARLRGLIENRTRMLAAISHDLRTPLTLLRLRAETVENAPEREKMLATIAEMDSMVAATLQFARDEARAEAAAPNRSRGSPRKRCRRYGRCGIAGDDGAGGAATLRMPAGRPEARDHQPARQRGEIRQAGASSNPLDTAGDRDHDRR